MFERYDEAARRVLFFARYECSQLGAQSIETEHLLLGLVREGKGAVRQLLESRRVTLERVRKDVEAQSLSHPKTPTSVEIPFSDEMVRVMQHAVSEADALDDAAIRPEHLLLALLREEQSAAGQLLAGYGLHLDGLRAALATEPEQSADPRASQASLIGDLDHIKALTDSLAAAAPGSEAAHVLAVEIHAVLDDLKRRLS